MVRVWAQTACRDNSQSGKCYPWKPIFPWRDASDGLLTGIVCLLPALASSLRVDVFVDVVGNMEDEGLNI